MPAQLPPASENAWPMQDTWRNNTCAPSITNTVGLCMKHLRDNASKLFRASLELKPRKQGIISSTGSREATLDFLEKFQKPPHDVFENFSTIIVKSLSCVDEDFSLFFGRLFCTWSLFIYIIESLIASSTTIYLSLIETMPAYTAIIQTNSWFTSRSSTISSHPLLLLFWHQLYLLPR